MKYFFDNDISYRLADMLRALGVDAIALRAVYLEDVKDPDFLGDLKSKHDVDVFISNDHAQRTNKVEAALLKSSGVTCLYFNPFWDKMQMWPQAKWLITRWETIEDFTKGARVGTCADIQQNGRCAPYQW